MIEKALPFSASEIKKAVDEYETPFYLYDEKGIRKTQGGSRQRFRGFGFP